MNELEALLILNNIPGLGPVRIKRLIERFSSARKVLALNAAQLAETGLAAALVQNILNFAADNFLKNEYKLLEKHQIKLVSLWDQEYPQNLKEISDAPILLYIRGEIPAESRLCVAVVGSRLASPYGLSVAEKLSGELAQMGITVVSGMARGIDTASHQGALKGHGPTVAVLGSGLAEVYPPENKNLFDEITKHGAIISEFSMETQPHHFNFPQRNRIISGLSLGVIVVEAALKSGALITADFALEQGREVFAVPGKVDAPNSQGVHYLIKQGAKLVGSIGDVLDELKLPLKQHVRRQKTLPDLPNEEAAIYDHVADEPLHIDQLAVKSGLNGSRVSGILLALELKQLVKQLPGKFFIKL